MNNEGKPQDTTTAKCSKRCFEKLNEYDEEMTNSATKRPKLEDSEQLSEPKTDMFTSSAKLHEIKISTEQPSSGLEVYKGFITPAKRQRNYSSATRDEPETEISTSMVQRGKASSKERPQYACTRDEDPGNAIKRQKTGNRHETVSDCEPEVDSHSGAIKRQPLDTWEGTFPAGGTGKVTTDDATRDSDEIDYPRTVATRNDDGHRDQVLAAVGYASDDDDDIDNDDIDNDDDGAADRFVERYIRVMQLIGSMAALIERQRVGELRQRMQQLWRASGDQRSSFSFFLNHPFRQGFTLSQLCQHHPSGDLTVLYVSGRLLFGALWQCPELAYRDRRPCRPDDLYCCTLMHLAIMFSSNWHHHHKQQQLQQQQQQGGTLSETAHVLLGDGLWCAPSLFWSDSLGLCPLHWAVLGQDVTLLTYLLHIMRRVWREHGDIPVAQNDDDADADDAAHHKAGAVSGLQDPPLTRPSKQTFAHILQTAFELNVRVVGSSGALFTLLAESLTWVHLSVRDFCLSDAVFLNSPTLVSRMLSEGCRVRPPRGPWPAFHPLHCAVMPLLLHGDVDVDSGLQRAQLSVVRLLLQHGADPNVLGYLRSTGVVCDTVTPLHVLLGPVRSPREFHAHRQRMVRLLLRYGADPQRVNEDGQACYHGMPPAVSRKFFAVVEDVGRTSLFPSPRLW